MSYTKSILESVVQELKSPEHAYLTAKGWEYDGTDGEYRHPRSQHLILYHRGNGQHYVGGGRFGKRKTIPVASAQQAHQIAMAT